MSLKIPSKKVYGRVLPHPEKELVGVALQPQELQVGQALYLRFSLVMLGTEQLLLPAFVLDDWGREIKKLALFEWIHFNGDRFPRAEIFGYVLKPTVGWTEVQCFVRDLELTARWPMFVCFDRNASPEASRPVAAIAWEQGRRTTPARISQPNEVGWPLARGRVSWWEIPPDTSAAHFL